MNKINNDDNIQLYIDHKNRLKSLQTKIKQYVSPIKKIKSFRLHSEDYFDLKRKKQKLMLKQQNRKVVNRIISSLKSPTNTRNQYQNKKDIVFYIKKKMGKSQALYHENLKIINRINHSQSELQRLKQCWISNNSQNYSKIHNKYTKINGKLILKKLDLFQKANFQSQSQIKTSRNQKQYCIKTHRFITKQ